ASQSRWILGYHGRCASSRRPLPCVEAGGPMPCPVGSRRAACVVERAGMRGHKAPQEDTAVVAAREREERRAADARTEETEARRLGAPQRRLRRFGRVASGGSVPIYGGRPIGGNGGGTRGLGGGGAAGLGGDGGRVGGGGMFNERI